MINDILRRSIANPYLRLPLVAVGMVLMLLAFGVVGFRPDKAVLKCRGIDIPKEVSVVQTEQYCICMRDTTDIADLEKRSQDCIERMRIIQQYTKDKLF